ncbi:MAG: hypothetical protein M1818_006851 [Claussenomyces sp. TS43310]|nr:MAG: hypothetical protein M1818_006851 [Claussenomyces sp. TS43310]
MEPHSLAGANGMDLQSLETADNTSSGESLTGHKRSLSGSIMSKLSFLRAPSENNQSLREHTPSSRGQVSDEISTSPKKENKAIAVAVHQQKSRRRKGSLRKAALLGRGAQREKKEMENSPLNTTSLTAFDGDGTLSPTSPEDVAPNRGFGLGIMQTAPEPSPEGSSGPLEVNSIPPLQISTTSFGEGLVTPPGSITSPTGAYISTTDEDEVLSTANRLLTRNDHLPSSESDSYFAGHSGSLTRRRSAQKPKSPLSIAGLAVNPLPVPNSDWDYSETEWWGWVVLIVTWIVFVIGMGSCLGVWSWAWDVGETPYAPPELEDDPTLPIVGYYPALMILTGVMAWVWVVVAWVGMKYFRHAKISGD